MGSNSSQPVAPDTQLNELSQYAQSLPAPKKEASSGDDGDTVTQKATKGKSQKYRRSTGNLIDGRAAAGLRQAMRRRSAVMDTSNSLEIDKDQESNNDHIVLEKEDAPNGENLVGSTMDSDILRSSHEVSRKSGKKRKRHTGRPTGLAIASPLLNDSEYEQNREVDVPESQIMPSSKHKQHRNVENVGLELDTADESENARREQIRPTPGATQDNEDQGVSKKFRKRKRQSETIPTEEKPIIEAHGNESVESRQHKRSRRRTQHEPNNASAVVSHPTPGENTDTRTRTLPSSPPIHNSIAQMRSPIQQTKSTGHVRDWLEDHIGSGITGGAIEPHQNRSIKKHGKIKRKVSASAKDTHEREAGNMEHSISKSNRKSSIPVLPNTATNAKQTASYAQQKLPTRRNHDPGLVKGKFTTEERQIAEDVFSDTCRELGIKAIDLTYEISSWGSSNAQVLAKALQEALPSRSGAALRKFSQRRWHNNDRGPWSSTDDERLRAAWNEQPNNWSHCSEQTNRTAADCSSRWRNYLRYDGKVETGPWSQDEEDKLRKVVEDCIKKIKNANAHNRALCSDREQLEKLLHWDTVSQMMGKRSAKRCNEKWVKLRKRNSSNWIPNNTMRDDQLFEGNLPKKIRLKKGAIAKLKSGDKVRILREIANADLSGEKIYRDESTFWSIVAQKAKSKDDRSLYSTAMRRWTYQEALEEYPEVLPRNGTIAANAKALAQHMTQRLQDDGQGLPQASRKELMRKRRTPGENALNTYRSEEFIEDSDSEDILVGHAVKPPALRGQQSDEDDANKDTNDDASDAEETITSLESSEHDVELASKVARKLFPLSEPNSNINSSAKKPINGKAKNRMR